MKIFTEQAIDNDQCWLAVSSRNINADGTFVYGVRSTKIYCRPSCSSRRPKRENVTFFDLPLAAEQAGFRPCLRCHPREAVILDRQLETIQLVCSHIEECQQLLTLATLSQRVGWNPHHLQRTFKRFMGITPRQYAQACRVKQLQARLREGNSVTQAMYDVGYGSSSRLYEKVPTLMGMTPATYRKGGQGIKIRYTLIDSPLGRLLVAATDNGVCAVSLGDDDMKLRNSLIQEYSNAQIQPDEAGLAVWVNAILEHLNGQTPDLHLPLDVQATAFQWRVWEALRAIPYGCTRSYKEIAEAIGNPLSVRAVARACATNPVSLIIPCHRVIRSDGNLGGYRWGLERKQALLKRELNLI